MPYVPVKERKKQQLMKLGRLGQLKNEGSNTAGGKSSSENERDDEEDDSGQTWGRRCNKSLLDQHTELKKLAEGINLIRIFFKFLWFLLMFKLISIILLY